ncbi:MAG: hypothetical protein AB8B69_10195 [Chitinophagales bacterium]
MSYEKKYQELREEYTDKEIAESMMIPADLSEEEANESRKELRELRFEKLRNMTESQRLFSDLMRLKIQMENYIEKEEYNEAKSFGVYLEEYIRILKTSKKKFSEDIKVHNTRLSRLLKGKEDLNIDIAYRLEKHSGGVIAAISWWKLLTKKQEYEIITNVKRKKEEGNKVANALHFHV